MSLLAGPVPARPRVAPASKASESGLGERSRAERGERERDESQPDHDGRKRLRIASMRGCLARPLAAHRLQRVVEAHVAGDGKERVGSAGARASRSRGRIVQREHEGRGVLHAVAGEGLGVDEPRNLPLADQRAHRFQREAHRLRLEPAQHQHGAGALGLVHQQPQACRRHVQGDEDAKRLCGCSILGSGHDATARAGEGLDVQRRRLRCELGW